MLLYVRAWGNFEWSGNCLPNVACTTRIRSKSLNLLFRVPAVFHLCQTTELLATAYSEQKQHLFLVFILASFQTCMIRWETTSRVDHNFVRMANSMFFTLSVLIFTTRVYHVLALIQTDRGDETYAKGHLIILGIHGIDINQRTRISLCHFDAVCHGKALERTWMRLLVKHFR